jgi:hypothetical protein
MNKQPFKKADTFIEHDERDLRLIFTKIKLLKDLNQKVLAYLDTNSAPYCQVANIAMGKLTLIAANGAIATQIRFQSNDLLRKFRSNPGLKHITSIECKVRPEQPLSPRLTSDKPEVMPALSAETAEIVKTMADTIEDPKLKEIMERIATRVS